MTLRATEASPHFADPPGFAELEAARSRIAGVARRTPLLESMLLNREAGRRVLVKAECLQHGGAFKFRGAWNHIRAIGPERRAAGVLAISSGNHAQGVARAAAILGCKATIVMPADAPTPKIRNTQAYGAEIISYDRATESREEIADRILAERGAHFVRPYDDPLVIAGQGTVGLEIAEDARASGVERADVIVPCSGGGLAAGCAIAFETAAPGLTVRTAEPAGFDDWARSISAGERQSNPAPTGSICDALLAESPGRITWAAGAGRFGPGLAVSDADALRAAAVAWRRLRIALEPSGAVGLAAVLGASADTTDPVIVVASGGNAEPALLAGTPSAGARWN